MREIYNDVSKLLQNLFITFGHYGDFEKNRKLKNCGCQTVLTRLEKALLVLESE
ncbi:hypothetical protein QG37_08368 [Candidozyma auris]|uniref:Uncharacterized protein n=1 Tax=Candidozyma auris TaxID=498019 RepID=A0A0L0NMP6_CANAR|nr:hypothetical protein QG37_08368 [[Candida] auris]